MHAEEIEIGSEGEFDVAPHERLVDVRERHPFRLEVRTLEEEPLTVHRDLPVVAANLAEGGAHGSVIADRVIDLDAHLQCAQRLLAEGARPPPRWLFHDERPFQPVLTGRERDIAARVEERLVVRPAHDCVQPRVPRGVAGVEVHATGEPASFARRFCAQDPQDRNSDFTAIDDAHGSPDATRVELGIEHHRLPEHSRDRALGRAVGLRRGCHLDPEDMVTAVSQRIRHLERVREEVTLGRAEVTAVEPDVAVVEDPLEGEEPPPALRQGGGGEAAPVEHRAVAAGEGRGAPPVAWHGDRLPAGVVEPRLDEPLVEVALGLAGQPPAAEFETLVRHRVGRLTVMFHVPPGLEDPQGAG